MNNNDTNILVNKSNSQSQMCNSERKFIDLLDSVPNDIKIIIFEYIQPSTLITLSKKYYVDNHFIIYKLIPHKYETYVRDIIRRDLDYPFSQILEENFIRWIGFKNYIYDHKSFANYVYFLQYYCIENDSAKCRIKLKEYFDKSGLSKNQHKKIIIRNIRK